ncbi:hypothetical protein BGX21_006707 [Mortierella sp. AD011]|nr:hypothetical protein BGX20_010661 [Mortierella sp. AD010]KAF9399166.1 hypothetical protein BGX21_006707 [Mortierella sp. AD011]
MPKWQILTLSDDNLSDPTKFKASPDLYPVKDESEDASVTKYLLSPQKALAIFLPKGFPESVTPNYWPFAKWQFIHNVAGSVTAVISTQSLLFAMGLGAGSIPMAAALNWIIKDGLGQLGGVVYASFVSDKFDSEPKRFRFQATVAMQGANLLELLTPLWPGYFLVIASISNIGKNMAWLASSATRAQMNKTFALRDNLGDITGKSGSQTTAAGLVAETVFHSVLNELVLDKEGYNKEAPTIGHLRQQLEALVPGPVEVAYDEVFVKPYKSPFNVPIDIEPSITRFASQGEEAGALSLAFRQTEFVQREQYYIMTDKSLVNGGRAGLCNGKVVIWFDKKAQTRDMVQGFYHACAARAILEKRNRQKNSSEGVSGTESDEWKRAVRAAHEQAIDTVPILVEVMDQKGWDTTSLFLTDGDHNRIELE